MSRPSKGWSGANGVRPRVALTHRPAGPPRRPQSCGDAWSVAVGPPAAYDNLLGSIGGLLSLATRRLALSLTAERCRTRTRTPRGPAPRQRVRNARLSARREFKACEGARPGVSGGVMGGASAAPRDDHTAAYLRRRTSKTSTPDDLFIDHVAWFKRTAFLDRDL